MGARPSRSRRVAREMAFQALHMVEVSGATGREAMETVLARQELEQEAASFLEDTLKGVLDDLDNIDQSISRNLSSKWTIDRLLVTDLSALRIGVFELFHRIGIPPKVTIAEAIEIAKKYGTKDSGAFINGVLGAVLKQSPKANWDPSMEEILEPDTDELTIEAEDQQESEEETVEEGTPEHDELMRKVGPWVIRTEE